MAGDRIPFDHDFPEKPEVVTLSQDTGVTIAEIMLRCHKLWRQFDRHTPDGFLENIGPNGVAILCGGNESFWKKFAAIGWLIFRDGGCEMPGFDERLNSGKGCAYNRMRSPEQRKAKAAERKRRQRERDRARDIKRDEERDICVTDPVTDPVTKRPHPPPTTYQEPHHCAATPRLSAQPTLTDVSAAWNAIPALDGLPGIERCKAATAKRQTAFRQRMREPYWREHWAEALKRLATSTFTQGGGKDGWRASLDWFLRPDSVARVLEGRYDDRQTSIHPAHSESHLPFLDEVEQ